MKMTALRIATIVTVLAIWPLTFVRAQQDETTYDQDIHVLGYKELPYPPIARSARIQGTVVIRVRVDDKGKVTNATAISGNKVLILVTLDNVKEWLFKPNASKTAVVIYRFTILDGECDSLSRIFIFHAPNVADVVTCPSETNP